MRNIHLRNSLAALALLACMSIGPVGAAAESQSSLEAEATIPQQSAARTALALVPDAKIKSAELEREHGKLIWSFEISKPNSRNISEVNVDAKTGEVVAVET